MDWKTRSAYVFIKTKDGKAYDICVVDAKLIIK